MTLEVIEPGVLTTVQDAGQPDSTHLGVPIGGVCDRWSLAVANLLAGNDFGDAALEMTIVGPTLAIDERTIIGLAGADLGGHVRETGRRLEPGRRHRLEAGTTIAFPGDGAALVGSVGSSAAARAYLAPAGGVDVAVVLGSRSTVLSGGFGGLDGRPLRAGDLVVAGAAGRGAVRSTDADRAPVAWPALEDDPVAGPHRSDPIRVLAGPAAPHSQAALESLLAGSWRVGSGSDRIGLRLEGSKRIQPPGGQVVSHGVVAGAIQLPPDGTPIVLLADAQTTGGYLVPAVAISADVPRLGQLRPGATVSFELVTLDEARAALIRQREALAAGTVALRDAAGWDDLWQSAGG